MSVLAVCNLEFRFSDFLLEATFELNGRVTGIFGPSGAGKTTLLEIIAGLRKPKKGVIQMHNEMISSSEEGVFAKSEDRRIGYVPQDLALFPHKTVRENLFYGRPLNQSEFDHISNQFQLELLLERYPGELSGGEKQRVAIGRALIINPRLLMLDEPLSNLDHELKEKGLELFKRVRDEFGTPVLYVAHDPNELVEICDDVIVLVNGKIQAQGPPARIFRPSDRPNFIFDRV
jgi:molybdate transport system ATP-binding protein